MGKEGEVGEGKGGEKREKRGEISAQAIPIAHSFGFCFFSVLGLPETKRKKDHMKNSENNL